MSEEIIRILMICFVRPWRIKNKTIHRVRANNKPSKKEIMWPLKKLITAFINITKSAKAAKRNIFVFCLGTISGWLIEVINLDF